MIIREIHNSNDRVPLPRGGHDAKLFLEKVVGKAEHAVLLPATKNKSRAVLYGQYLKVLNRRFKRQLQAGSWFTGKESDAQHYVGAGLGLPKGADFEKVFQLSDCLQDHRDVMSECRQEFLFDLP